MTIMFLAALFGWFLALAGEVWPVLLGLGLVAGVVKGWLEWCRVSTYPNVESAAVSAVLIGAITMVGAVLIALVVAAGVVVATGGGGIVGIG